MERPITKELAATLAATLAAVVEAGTTIVASTAEEVVAEVAE